MPVTKKDLAFRLPKISYVDYKTIDMDRVLLNLYPKLRFSGGAGRSRNSDKLISVEAFKDYFTAPENAARFPGFSDHPDVVYRWLETDLLDLVNRGKDNQAVVAPRPLHGSTYRYRTKHARDYYTADQVYWMLHFARSPWGNEAITALRQYVFDGLDLNTEQIRPTPAMDVETQAILLLPERSPDQKDSAKPETFPPLCLRQADLLAEDVLRLLAYEKQMPRTVLIEHLKTLFAFHLGLYHFKLLKLLPLLVAGRGGGAVCGGERCANSMPLCRARIGFVLDCTGGRDTRMARLARTSADIQYRRIPAYIEAHYIIRKMEEMALDQIGAGKLSRPARGYFTVEELLTFLGPAQRDERKNYFAFRLYGLLEQTKEDDEQPPAIERILTMRQEAGMDDLETFIEILMTLRGSYHRRYLTQCLDAFLLKNSENGLLRQLRAKGSPREFSLGSRLLELLLQLAVCEPHRGHFRTREIRLEDLLVFLRDRYGLFIETLPIDDGFEQASVDDNRALRANRDAFKERLREIGYFQVLSDAYLSQTITPRYTIK